MDETKAQANKKDEPGKKGNNMDKLEKKVEEAISADKVLLNQLKIMQADFENYRKRIEKDNKETIKYANFDLMKDLLPIIDSFEKALVLTKDDGIKLLYSNFRKILEKNGLKGIKSVGEKFDFNVHEAVLTVTGKGEDNMVVEEAEKGYLLHDKVLRPAKVIVNKKV
ncbi:Protein GrpE [Candidatus Tiddalikarchaeum anstoanum]|nr:Protein GrpE [Candidatus Tiddalikarchaeum anstoanum]